MPGRGRARSLLATCARRTHGGMRERPVRWITGKVALPWGGIEGGHRFEPRVLRRRQLRIRVASRGSCLRVRSSRGFGS